jgi:diguanylate cyclase (GGDEF)-like protein/PAS domain S-box-containing protein
VNPNMKSDSRSKGTKTKKLSTKSASTQPGFPIEITGDKQAEEAFQISETSLVAVLQSTADGILAIGNENEVLFANERFEKLWRIPQAVMASKDDSVLLQYILDQLSDPQSFLKKVQELYKSTEDSFDTLNFKDGRVFERQSRPFMQGAAIAGRVWSFHDVTERKRAENLFRQEHEFYLDLVNNQPVGIYRIRVFPREQWQEDAWINPEHPPYTVDLASDRFCEMLGIDRQVYENNPGIVEDLIHPEDKDDFSRRNEEANAGMVLFQWEGRLIIRGEIHWVHFESIPRLIENGVVLWTGTLDDITDRKRAEEEIRNLSLTDELTGLYNRRGFMLLAEQAMKLAHRIKTSMLLFFGDLDNLKTINDTHGHAQGDLALQEVSAILKETFREADILARIGGDEFVVLAVDASMESADVMTNRIQAELEKRNLQGDRRYQLTLSMGITHYDPEAPCTVSELIAQADDQMYQQKQARKAEQ